VGKVREYVWSSIPSIKHTLFKFFLCLLGNGEEALLASPHPRSTHENFFCGDKKLGEVFLPLPYGKTL